MAAGGSPRVSPPRAPSTTPAHAAPVTRRSRRAPTSPTTARSTRRPRPAKSSPTSRPRRPAQTSALDRRQPPSASTAEAKPELLVPGSLARYVDGLAAAPDVGAGGGPGDHLGGQPDRSACPTSTAAATRRSSPPATTARAPCPSRCTAPTCSTSPEDSSEFMAVGLARGRTLGDDLLQRRPRLHDRRGAAPGHQRRRRPHQPAGSALAPAAPANAASRFATRSGSERRLRGRLRLTVCGRAKVGRLVETQ